LHHSFRYHVASIVGVLFSLVLGILIGGALFQDDRLVKEQGLIISELESQFAELKASVTALTERERVLNQSWQRAKTILLDGLLQDKQILLISDPADSEDQWQEIGNLLTAAGAAYRKIGWQELEECEDFTESAALLWLRSPLDNERTALVQKLSSAGVHIAFLRTGEMNVSLPEQRTSLCIDMTDSLLGELGLVIGLAAGASGYYGTGPGAVAVLPELVRQP
jgi:hypothetical protein